MKIAVSGVAIIGVIASALALIGGATVSAHVVVKPSETVTAGFQTFTMGVPNERDVSTTRVKLEVPASLQYVTPTQKAGWTITVEKDGAGEEAKTKSITWAGNTVKQGFRDDFTFSAKVPDNETTLQWNAYQTYADGVVVSWDKESEGGHGETSNNSGPFSVTQVVAKTAQDTALQNAEKAAADAKATATMASYVGVAAAIVGLAALFFATRKK